MAESNVNIVIATGGTAGHVVPSLAVADALSKRGARVTFIGSEGRTESQLVPQAGYQLHQIKVAGLDRSNPLKAAAAALKACAALVRARGLLKRLKADGVVGGGGYVSGPVGLAAASLGLPLVITEADSYLGITNRVLARFARRVCLSFPIEGREEERYLVTGRPLPPAAGAVDKAAARRELELPLDAYLLVVFGGSQGARSINDAAVEAFCHGMPELARQLYIVHVSGRRDYAEVKQKLDALKPRSYRLLDYVWPNFGTLLAAADLVVGRAGGSIFEIAAAGKPSILVPYPHATRDHQTKNASWLVAAGAAVLVPDGELSGDRLKSEVVRILSRPQLLEEMGAKAAAKAIPDAAERVATAVLAEVGQS